MTLSGSGDIIILLSRTRAQPVSLLAQHGRVLGRQRKISRKNSKENFEKALDKIE